MHGIQQEKERLLGSAAEDAEAAGDLVTAQSPSPDQGRRALADWRTGATPRRSSVILNVGKTTEQVRMRLQSVSYTVDVGKGNGDPLPDDPTQKASTRKILHDVSACFAPGQLTALMGPSGAGKTTLMNVLTDNCKHTLEGDVLANGQKIDAAFKSYFNLVPQEDVLLPALTARETLRYAAELRLSKAIPTEEREERITKILQVLGLDDGVGGGCADTIVGSVEQRGISGGQRKRLSIGLELLTNPSVLFLDEPTSGLDSKAAEDVIKVLRALAKSGKTVVCTIHQPSWKLFERFDRLLLLCKGKVVYDGPTRLVPGYVNKLGEEFGRDDWAVPARENPIDHVMRVIQEGRDAATFAESWGTVPRGSRELTLGQRRLQRVDSEHRDAITRESGQPPLSYPDYDPAGDHAEPDPPALSGGQSYENGKFRQYSVLFRRFMYETSKNKQKFVAQCALKLTVGLLVGLCWFDASRPPDFGTNGSSAFTVTGSLFLCINNCLMDNIFATVIGFPTARSLLLREYKNGSYSLMPWFFALFFSTMVFQVIYTLILSVPVYTMVGLRLDGIQYPLIFVGTLLLASGIGVALGIAVGATSDDVREAQQKILPTIVPMLLFSGWVIPYDNIPVFLKWVYWVSMFQYSFNILKVNQFDGLSFHDQDNLHKVLPVPCKDILKGAQDVCRDVGLPEGGLLTVSTAQAPVSGRDYLVSQNLDPDDNPMWRNFVILAAYLIVCLFPAYRIIRYKARQKSG
eukprot:TRINITY_DN3792_c0_g1_i1.p1 TRINITY_DN3792_c0_g1~~TRINITY_DN3792_c0_g1_i1.p1  ORF type:complete len:745 (+),score=248.74 TRINITY_DN3792_c0_g1_i1:47-2281(+)